jgi:predicted transposase/invertase (TIGR01784 family)
MPLEDKYVNPLTDFGFKKLFGEEVNKDLLIDFLNELLPEKHKIKYLNYQKNEHLPSSEYDRKAIFDLFCESASGEKFIVEVQRAKQNYFKDRSVYYSSFPIQNQAIKGNEWNFKLNAVYTIGIFDFIWSGFNPYKVKSNSFMEGFVTLYMKLNFLLDPDNFPDLPEDK